MEELIKKLLVGRGITKDEEIDAFLNPDYEAHTHDPLGLLGMDEATARTLEAIEKKEKIRIWSDFDADGIPAAVVLSDVLKKIGHENFSVSMPHRNTEGFGLNEKAITECIENDVKLLITLDCGMGDARHIKRAREAGIDVIVIDHHRANGGGAPECIVINPNQDGDTYPNKHLCGAGVTYKLVQALLQKSSKLEASSLKLPPPGWEKWLLDMVAIATLSDMVPLVGENRALVHYGLIVLRKSPRPGLRALCEHTNIRQSRMTEDDVVFSITPRINAASRMDEPETAFRILSTQDEAEAEMLAGHLDSLNNERKGVVAAMSKEAKGKLGESVESPVIVIGNPHWQPGLLGLVATHVVETYKCPAFVWGRGDSDVIKGSVRSDGSVDVMVLMEEVKELFLEYGGHTRSGGFSTTVEHIIALPDALSEAYGRVKDSGETKAPDADHHMSLDDVNLSTWNVLSKLAPFGMGNDKPIFLFEGVEVLAAEPFGKEKQHARLTFLNSSGRSVSAIKFFAKEPITDIAKGDTVNLFATMENSTFGRSPEIRLRIVDITKTGA